MTERWGQPADGPSRSPAARASAEAPFAGLREETDRPCADDLESLAGGCVDGEAARPDLEEDRWLGWCAVTGPLERWNPDPEQALGSHEIMEVLLAALTADERTYVGRWLGLDGRPPESQADLARDAGVSPTRMGHLLVSACGRMRHRVRLLSDAFDDACFARRQKRRRKPFQPPRLLVPFELRASAAMAREALDAVSAIGAVMGEWALGFDGGLAWESCASLEVWVLAEDVPRLRAWLRARGGWTHRHPEGGLRVRRGAVRVDFLDHCTPGAGGQAPLFRETVTDAHRGGTPVVLAGVVLPRPSGAYVASGLLASRSPRNRIALRSFVETLDVHELGRARALAAKHFGPNGLADLELLAPARRGGRRG